MWDMATGGYSQISVAEPGQLAFLSGQVAAKPGSDDMPKDLVGQAKLVTASLAAALNELEASAQDIVMMRVYIVKAVNAVREAPPQIAEMFIESLEASQNQEAAQSIAFVRIVRAMSHLVNILHIDKAAAQSSDLQVLLTLLQEPEVQARLAESDPLAPAKIRGLKLQTEILNAEGGCVFSTQFSELVGMTPQGVDKARKAGTLIAFPRGQAKFGYPIWQVHQGAVLRGLKESIRALGDASMFTKANFFLSANSRLSGNRPLDLLRQEEANVVIDAATAFGEHGAS